MGMDRASGSVYFCVCRMDAVIFSLLLERFESRLGFEDLKLNKMAALVICKHAYVQKPSLRRRQQHGGVREMCKGGAREVKDGLLGRGADRGRCVYSISFMLVRERDRCGGQQ